MWFVGSEKPCIYSVPNRKQSYDNGNQIYKFGESLTYKSYEDYFVFYPYYSVERIKITELELHEYVQSNDRNAYPDSGISENYEYQYLGQPFGLDNLLGGAKIATGSYTGTGTYGASSPNSLTFEFEPKLLIIASAISGKQFTFVRDSTVAIQHNASTGSGNLAHSEYAPVVEWNGKTVTWYTTGNPDAQANEIAKKYQYIAIG